MSDWEGMLRQMAWIAFVLLCLWFMKTKLGGGASELLKTLLHELKRLPFLRTERAGLNMMGGLILFLSIATYFLFDSVGRIQKITAATGTASVDGRVALAVCAMAFTAIYFLLCAAMVGPPPGSEE